MKKNICVKLGGRAATDVRAITSLVVEMSKLAAEHHFVLVHGGGAEVSKVSRIYGLEPRFIDGVRMTPPAEMDIVDMVLAGKMNKYLVRLFQANGINAAGLCGVDGRLFTGEAIGSATENRTGKITTVNTDIIRCLEQSGFLPVISSVSMDETGGALNINADEAALAVARDLPASRLIFISDIPGILKHNEVLKMLNVSDIEDEINIGTIIGGMVPKVRSSAIAVKNGVGEIIIGQYAGQGDLQSLIEGKSGSRIIG